MIRFAPQRDHCLCGVRLAVQKTRQKTVLSLTGPFVAHEILLYCPACSRVFDSEALLRLVPPRCNVAYDVMVFIGRGLFLRYRSTDELRLELLNRNVRLCPSEVDYLGRKFILFLAEAHRRATPQIRRQMTRAGGYILHLDATHEGDPPALMTGLDGLSRFVLANIKVPSESAAHIIPFLRDIEESYGTPRACVHDMGTGICKAVAEAFPHTPDYICHFHFLRDIGKDILEPSYRELRNRLRSHGATSRLSALVRDARQRITDQCSSISGLAKAVHSSDPPKDNALIPLASSYSLALWALQGKHVGDGYGFPFDRPLLQFAERLLDLNKHLTQILQQDSNEADRKPLLALERVVLETVNDSSLLQAVEELRWRSDIFDSLRKAMRIAPIGGGTGLNHEGTPESLGTIQHGVEQFRRKLDQDPRLAADPLCRKMAEQIDKYAEKLFADPIEVNTPTGKVTICPQRTNNILEQFFRRLRRGHRRKTGNNSMSRVLHAMLADTPLVKNLDNPHYMEVLLDGRASLEELFSELGRKPFTHDNKSQRDIDRILPGFRAIIKLPKLPEQVLRLFSTAQQNPTSN